MLKVYSRYFGLFLAVLFIDLISSVSSSHEPHISLMDHFLILQNRLSDNAHKEGVDFRSLKIIAQRLQEDTDSIQSENHSRKLANLINHGSLSSVLHLTVPSYASIALNRVKLREHPDRLQVPS